MQREDGVTGFGRAARRRGSLGPKAGSPGSLLSRPPVTEAPVPRTASCSGGTGGQDTMADDQPGLAAQWRTARSRASAEARLSPAQRARSTRHERHLRLVGRRAGRRAPGAGAPAGRSTRMRRPPRDPGARCAQASHRGPRPPELDHCDPAQPNGLSLRPVVFVQWG